MRLMRIVLTAILVAFAPTQAFAAPAPAVESVVAAPQWRIGSTWEYSDGYGLRVASASAAATVFERTDASGQWFSMRGFLRQDAASATAKRQTIYRSVPPSAGDGLNTSQSLTFQREYLSNSKLVVHATSWTVEGRQTITVPAGTFDCWVIVWRARSLKGNWTGFERWWYSPEAQLYVRMEYKYGPMNTASRVLMTYHLGQPVAPQAAGQPPSAGTALQAVPALRPLGSFETMPLDAPGPASMPLIKPDVSEPEPRASAPMTVPAPPALPEPKLSVSSPRVAPAATPGGRWIVQLVSGDNETDARKELSQFVEKYSEIVADLPNGIEATDTGNGKFYRLWFGGYDASLPATALCDRLKSAGVTCFVHQREQRIAVSP